MTKSDEKGEAEIWGLVDDGTVDFSVVEPFFQADIAWANPRRLIGGNDRDKSRQVNYFISRLCDAACDAKSTRVSLEVNDGELALAREIAGLRRPVMVDVYIAPSTFAHHTLTCTLRPNVRCYSRPTYALYAQP